jgi:3-dehydroquinate dehydratase/shikimate dehydrogenase
MIEKYRPYIDVAELRADCLSEEERFSVRRFPEIAGIPVILTVRRKCDGGCYEHGEKGRIELLSKALAFAETDVRRNFAYIDLEEDTDFASLEEAARAFGTRIIRSFHSLKGPHGDLLPRLKALYHVGDEIAKAAIAPDSLDDLAELFRVSKAMGDADKILICMDGASRILAKKLGSYLCYTSVKGEDDFPPAAPGHIDPVDLITKYRFRSITKDADVYGITGYPLTATGSPAFFNSVFDREGKDAVYLPFPSAEAAPFFRLADEIGLKGASVTVPHKEETLKHLFEVSDDVDAIGACNTVVRTERGWEGYNTDAGGFSGALLGFINKNDLRGVKVTIVGAGGAAKAVASEVARLRGKALILNRSRERAQELASRYGFNWAGLDAAGIKQMKKFAHVIVQTTSVGMEPDIEGDPVPHYEFTGKEAVMDIIYKPERTLFLKRAEEAGCRVRNGSDMLLRQAKLQYALFFGRAYPYE